MSIPAVTYDYLCDPQHGICPELSQMPVGVVDALNPVGLLYVSERVYGKASQYALGLAIAHLYTLGKNKGMGPVTSLGIGEDKVGYGELSTTDSLQSTTYGMRLRELGRMLRPGGIQVGQGQGMVPPFGNYQPTWTYWTTQWRGR